MLLALFLATAAPEPAPILVYSEMGKMACESKDPKHLDLCRIYTAGKYDGAVETVTSLIADLRKMGRKAEADKVQRMLDSLREIEK